jgi:hypothetical protein
MVRTGRRTPRDFSDDWPNAVCSDPDAEVLRQFVLRLLDAMDGRTRRGVSELTEVTPSVLTGIILGQRWPDTATLARLERGLDADLWPGRIRGRPSRRR